MPKSRINTGVSAIFRINKILFKNFSLLMLF
nr:MAG TPA: hypothetical protein [Caudoviricetes sp.]